MYTPKRTLVQPRRAPFLPASGLTLRCGKCGAGSPTSAQVLGAQSQQPAGWVAHARQRAAAFEALRLALGARARRGTIPTTSKRGAALRGDGAWARGYARPGNGVKVAWAQASSENQAAQYWLRVYQEYEHHVAAQKGHVLLRTDRLRACVVTAAYGGECETRLFERLGDDFDIHLNSPTQEVQRWQHKDMFEAINRHAELERLADEWISTPIA